MNIIYISNEDLLLKSCWRIIIPTPARQPLTYTRLSGHQVLGCGKTEIIEVLPRSINPNFQQYFSFKLKVMHNSQIVKFFFLFIITPEKFQPIIITECTISLSTNFLNELSAVIIISVLILQCMYLWLLVVFRLHNDTVLYEQMHGVRSRFIQGLLTDRKSKYHCT